MALYTALFLGVFFLLLSICTAQFGVPGNKKKAATTFEEVNEMAKERFAGADVDAMGNINLEEALAGVGGLGDADIAKYFDQAMNDPETMKMMQELGGGMQEAMEKLKDLSPEELQEQMKQAMDMFSSGKLLDGLTDNMPAVLENLEKSGMVPKEKIEEFRNDPSKFAADMNEAMSHLGEIFSDPAALDAATKIAKGFSEAAANPEKAVKQMEDYMAKFSEALSSELSNDDKIEEARLQLLANPELAGGGLSSMFDSEEMKDILNDPVKWKESVKKGQGMLLGQATA